MDKLFKISKGSAWALGMLCKYLIVILAFVLYTVLVARAATAKADKKYEAWRIRFASEYTSQQLARAEAERLSAPIDPYEAKLSAESDMLAKVLYGVRQNSTDDLKTYAWCVLNRVDSPDYPDTLEEVIAQPSQWMRYSSDNPVIENLYQIAREELETWHAGTRRPVSAEFVFMNWTPSRIVLRDRWEEGSMTEYWRWGK